MSEATRGRKGVKIDNTKSRAAAKSNLALLELLGTGQNFSFQRILLQKNTIHHSEGP